MTSAADRHKPQNAPRWTELLVIALGYGLSWSIDSPGKSMSPCKKIVLGVTGGIAAYKTPELVRRLLDRGAEVQVVMTRSAEEFGPSRGILRLVPISGTRMPRLPGRE